MLKSIFKNAIDYMKNDHKIIRLTLATSFFHSLIASLLILLNVNTLFARNYENGLYVGKVAEFFVQEITNNHVIGRVITIAILLFIAYSIASTTLFTKSSTVRQTHLSIFQSFNLSILVIMLKSIFKNAIDYMKNDHKIIRLTLATSFFHSLIASLLILLNVNTLFARNYENGLYVGKVAEFFVQEITNNHVIGRVITIAILLFIAYSIVYPIGQAAIIYYFNSKTRSIKAALKKGREVFFPMFEYGIVSLFLAPLVYWLVILKIIVSGKPLTSFTVFMLLIWFVAMSIINCLKIYTRYIMIIEGKGVYEAVIKSCNLSLKNFKEGMKYLGAQTNLIVNFSFNIFIILLIPIVLIYLAIVFNVIQYPAVKRSVYGLFFLGIIFGSYASSMVRAFCAYLRREIYKKVAERE